MGAWAHVCWAERRRTWLLNYFNKFIKLYQIYELNCYIFAVIASVIGHLVLKSNWNIYCVQELIAKKLTDEKVGNDVPRYVYCLCFVFWLVQSILYLYCNYEPFCLRWIKIFKCSWNHHFPQWESFWWVSNPTKFCWNY